MIHYTTIADICRLILEDVSEVVKSKKDNKAAIDRLQKRLILKKNDTLLGVLVKIMSIVSKIPPQASQHEIAPDSVDVLSDDVLELTLNFCQKTLQSRRERQPESDELQISTES